MKIDPAAEIFPFLESEEFHRLSAPQRAFMVSKLCNVPKDIAKAKALKMKENRSGDVNTSPRVTIKMAADMAGVSKALVQEAKVVWDRGTKDQQEAVASGRKGPRTVANAIRAAERKQEGRKKRAQDSTKHRENAVIWGEIRKALESLTSLPQASDTVRIMLFMDRHGLVDRKIDRALQHLQEIHHEWKSGKNAE